MPPPPGKNSESRVGFTVKECLRKGLVGEFSNNLWDNLSLIGTKIAHYISARS